MNVHGLGETQHFHGLKVSPQINSLGKNCIFKVEKYDKHLVNQVTRLNIINSEPTDTLGFFFFSCFFKNLSVIDLQCCVNFCCTAVIQLYIYIHSFSYQLNKKGDNILAILLSQF